MKDELVDRMTEFVVLRPKTYSFIRDDNKNDSGTYVTKKAKETKKCLIKKFLNLMVIKIAY